MIPNKFIHSFLHSYKRKYLKRQYVNEILKFHISDFQFSGRGLRPRFLLARIEIQSSTRIYQRIYARGTYVCSVVFMVNQMMMQRLKRQYSVLIVDSYLQMYETDTHGVYCSRCSKIENLFLLSWNSSLIYMSVCHLTIASSNYIYLFLYVLFQSLLIYYTVVSGAFMLQFSYFFY